MACSASNKVASKPRQDRGSYPRDTARLAQRDERGVRLFSRNGYNLTSRFPKIGAAIWPISSDPHFPDPAKRQAVTNAIVAVNVGIDIVVRARRHVALVDLYNYVDSPKYKSRISLARGTVTVGREQISFPTPDDEPHHVMLSDDEHSGAVVQCLVANYIFIDPISLDHDKHAGRNKPQQRYIEKFQHARLLD